jgi:hypothetical protein
MASKPEPDLGGNDFVIQGTAEVGDDYPLIKLQVKSWSESAGDDSSWHYRGLTEKQFNILAGERQVPIYLVLVLVPRDVACYTAADVDYLQLSHAAYWASLRTMEKVPNPGKRKVPVRIPKGNLLTVRSLIELCEKVDRDQHPLTTARGAP